MVQAGHRTGFWRSVRELPGRTPLRVKLITAVLALVAIALLVISVAGIGFLQELSARGRPTTSSTRCQGHRTIRPPSRRPSLAAARRSCHRGTVIDWLPAAARRSKSARCPAASPDQFTAEHHPGPEVLPGRRVADQRAAHDSGSASGTGRWQVVYPDSGTPTTVGA